MQHQLEAATAISQTFAKLFFSESYSTMSQRAPL